MKLEKHEHGDKCYKVTRSGTWRYNEVPTPYYGGYTCSSCGAWTSDHVGGETHICEKELVCPYDSFSWSITNNIEINLGS